MKDQIVAVLAIIALVTSIMALSLEISSQISDVDSTETVDLTWTSENDGSNSGLDADKLDGYESSQFLRNDVSGTIIGDLTVQGSIIHQPEIRYYTVPAAAFIAGSHGDIYYNGGWTLRNGDPLNNRITFWAPINLPDNAKITKLYIKYQLEDDLASINLTLIEIGDTSGSLDEFYTTELPSGHGYGDPMFESEIIDKTILNFKTAYLIRVYMTPHGDLNEVGLNWVTIEYTVITG